MPASPRASTTSRARSRAAASRRTTSSRARSATRCWRRRRATSPSRIAKQLLGPGLVVSDDEVLDAMELAFREFKLVVEPGGAVALAAALTGKLPVKGRAVAVVCSGGNVDHATFAAGSRVAAPHEHVEPRRGAAGRSSSGSVAACARGQRATSAIAVAEEPLRGIATGIASSLFIATPILLLEVKGRRLPVVRRLQRLPLVVYFAVRVVFYVDRHRRRPDGCSPGGHAGTSRFDEIFDGGGFSSRWPWRWWPTSSSRWAACWASARVGSLLTGRYVRPRREQRAFLLIDMKNSTGHRRAAGRRALPRAAERLLPRRRRSRPGMRRGDPQVRRRRGHPDLARRPRHRSTATCSPAPSSLRDFIAANSAQYRRRFGVVPEFRAAMHCGEIVAGEIGDVRARDRLCRRHAERRGAAARGRQGARPRRAGLGRSAGQATLPAGIVAETLPTLTVRGREAPLGIAALSRA